MGFYSIWLLPRLLDLTMRQHRLLPYRERTISASAHATLEIGLGSGLNLSLYREVESVCGIDPSPELLTYATRRIGEACRPVFLARASAEAIPFGDEGFDTVVMTWTLCTIPRPLEALREMRRVLKPEGRLLFVEHGLAPEPGVQRWQSRLTPIWKRISGGCHLNRKMDDLIRSAGFEIVDLHKGYMAGPRPMTYMYEGSAIPQ